jgi:phosphatidylglycerophosphate synthase
VGNAVSRSGADTLPSTRVVSTTAKGLVLVLAAAWGLRSPLQLDVLTTVRAGALFTAIMLLAIRFLPGHHPFRHFGAANQVTTIRAALASIIAGLIGAPETPLVADTAVALAIVAAGLDGLDGWLARRSGMSSGFGARFDMEIDALMIMVLAMLAWRHGKAGPWVLASGLLRYAFLGIGLVLPRLRRELAVSRRRQVVCVVQVCALIVIMIPEVPFPQSAWIAAAALAALSYSFFVDLLWLWRHAAGAPVTIRP